MNWKLFRYISFALLSSYSVVTIAVTEVAVTKSSERDFLHMERAFLALEGTACIQALIQSRSGTRSALNQCVCGPEAKQGYKDIQFILRKNPSWRGSKVTYANKKGYTQFLDMKDRQQLLDNHEQNCQK